MRNHIPRLEDEYFSKNFSNKVNFGFLKKKSRKSFKGVKLFQSFFLPQRIPWVRHSGLLTLSKYIWIQNECYFRKKDFIQKNSIIPSVFHNCENIQNKIRFERNWMQCKLNARTIFIVSSFKIPFHTREKKLSKPAKKIFTFSIHKNITFHCQSINQQIRRQNKFELKSFGTAGYLFCFTKMATLTEK